MIWRTDPFSPWTDRDGLPDGAEAAGGSNPRVDLAGCQDWPEVQIGGAAVLSNAAADLDGDGDVDLVYGSEVELGLYENAAGALLAPTIVDPLAVDVSEVAVADLDGDGDADIAAADPDGAVSWYENLAPSPSGRPPRSSPAPTRTR